MPARPCGWMPATEGLGGILQPRGLDATRLALSGAAARRPRRRSGTRCRPPARRRGGSISASGPCRHRPRRSTCSRCPRRPGRRSACRRVRTRAGPRDDAGAWVQRPSCLRRGRSCACGRRPMPVSGVRSSDATGAHCLPAPRNLWTTKAMRSRTSPACQTGAASAPRNSLWRCGPTRRTRRGLLPPGAAEPAHIFVPRYADGTRGHRAYLSSVKVSLSSAGNTTAWWRGCSASPGRSRWSHAREVGLPCTWKKDSFEVLWLLQREDQGYRFSPRNQALLKGDKGYPREISKSTNRLD